MDRRNPSEPDVNTTTNNGNGSPRSALSSELSGFHRLTLEDRRARLAELTGLSERELEVLSAEGGLSDDQANRMVENVLGVMSLPLGLCVNLRIDGRDCLVPMAIEEPSVVAAASFASKLLRAGGGLITEVTPPHMIGQIQLLDVPDARNAERAVMDAKHELLTSANEGHPSLIAAGGGAIDVEVHHFAPMTELSGGFTDPCGPMMVVHLVVDVRDAMGANAINSMCERIAPRVCDLTGGRSGLKILSNLTDRRMVLVKGRVPFDALAGRGCDSPAELANGIVEASVFAERDPYRAATHNKGIMNGVDSVLLAFGQDWRAVEAGAHAYAARTGRYTALARWRVEGESLVGVLEMPLAVGTVGGVARVHPTVKVARRVAHVHAAAELAALAGAVGLAQNLSALRAMVAEGIQKGHMRLHARNVAVEAGATGEVIDEVAEMIAHRGSVSLAAAKEALAEIIERRREASTIPPMYAHESGSPGLLDRFRVLRDQYWPEMTATIERLTTSSTPPGSTLVEMCSYHMETGGKRLRALLPLLVAEALEIDPKRLVPFGAACEMLHNATLVHDDLQDGDMFRRGRMTVWNRYGIPQAINLGDAMFYFSVLLTQQIDAPALRREQASRLLLVETLRVIDGQEREFALKTKVDVTLDDYYEMVEGKTSGLFALPMAGAAMLCDASDELCAGLGEAARHMGVLFQIQDDTLDLYGEKGRDARGSDIGEGKRSALVVHALAHAGKEDAAWLRELLDRDRAATTQPEVDRAIALLTDAGSLRYALQEMERRKARALSVPAVAARPSLQALVRGMCELFLKPIEPLFASQEVPR
jgi:hydroxymethylglutaryl-CoA reductase